MASSLQYGKVPTSMMATPVKQKDESPQSQPSMAGTSVGSSPSEHSAYKESPSLVKQLFRVETMADFYRPTRRTSAPTPTPSGSPKSTTSSEATVVASWNLSNSKSMLDGGPLDTPPRYIDPWNSADGFPRTHAFAAAPAVMEEVHPEEHPTGMSCSTLTQGPLADMFVSLQKGRSIWSKDPETPPARNTPEPSSSPAIDPRQVALWRECQELKRIIQEDSLRIINMKRAMEAQQELNELKEVELEDKQMELQIAMSRIECLKKEKAVIWERQDELLETIEILKEEVDKLSVLVDRHIDTESAAPRETLPVILDECILPDASSVVDASVAETCSTVEEVVIEEVIEEEIVEESDVLSFTDESIDSDDEDPLEVAERAVSEVTLDEEEEDEILVVQLPRSLGPAQGEQALEVVRVPLFEVCEEDEDEEEMIEEEPFEVQVDETVEDDVEENKCTVAEESKELTLQEAPVVEALDEDTSRAETQEATVVAAAPPPVPDLTSLLESLSKRLERMENEKVSNEQKLLEALERKNAELEEIRQTLKLDPNTVEFLKILQDPDEIEVFVPKGKDDFKDTTLHSSCCCGTLPAFTDDIE